MSGGLIARPRAARRIAGRHRHMQCLYWSMKRPSCAETRTVPPCASTGRPRRHG